MFKDGMLCCLYYSLELSMGPFCVTQSNPTHQLTDPTTAFYTKPKD